MPLPQRSNDPDQLLPPALVRRYEVLITPRNDAKPLRMREVQSASIGHLVTVRVSSSPRFDKLCTVVPLQAGLSDDLKR